MCDPNFGVEVRLRKSLERQAEMGPVFGVTLDGEDGAPVGGEREHAALMAELVMGAGHRFGRVGGAVQPVEHPGVEDVVNLVETHGGLREVAAIAAHPPPCWGDVLPLCLGRCRILAMVRGTRP